MSEGNRSLTTTSPAIYDRITKLELEAMRLREALMAVRPYLGAIICYASTIDEHDGNRVAVLVERALK